MADSKNNEASYRVYRTGCKYLGSEQEASLIVPGEYGSHHSFYCPERGAPGNRGEMHCNASENRGDSCIKYSELLNRISPPYSQSQPSCTEQDIRRGGTWEDDRIDHAERCDDP